MLQKFVSNLSEKERRVFYIAAIFVAFALLDRLFMGPILIHIERLDEQIDTEKINIIRDQRFLAYGDEIQKESRALDKYFTKTVPDDDVVNAAFLSLVEQIATQTHVSLVKSNPSHINTKEKYNEYVANVDCNGTLEDVIAFMHRLNTTEELLKVVKFNMSPKRGAENEVKISLTVVKLIVH